MEKQEQFMRACGQVTTRPMYKQCELYKELIREEVVGELFPALESWIDNPLDPDSLRETLDAIGDSLVVIEGLAYSMGADPKEIKSRIDDSNLTKIPAGNNLVKKRADGKILKPDSFKLPVLDDLAENILKKVREN